MAPWVPEWMRGMYAYATGGRRGGRNRRPHSSSSSSVASSAGAHRKKNAQSGGKKGEKGALGVQGAGVKKRSLDPKSPSGKRNRKKSGAGRNSDVNSDADVSSQKITAAEQAAVNAEVVIEAVERLDREDPKYDDWTDAEIILFNQLQDRGLEPLLSTSFKLDFPTLPKEVFTDNDEATFINSRKGNNLHAIRALQSLFKVGNRMRSRLVQKRHASHVLARTIDAYIKWAMDDADLSQRDVLPILSVKASRQNEKHHGAIKRTRKELHRLAVLHRERYDEAIAASNTTKGKQTSQYKYSMNNSGPGIPEAAHVPDIPGAIPPPVLFGIILVKGVMTFAALDASLEDSKLQTVAIFDWAQSGQDVWNALAVAILVMMVRNYQESLEADVMENDPEDDDEDEDPDA